MDTQEQLDKHEAECGKRHGKIQEDFREIRADIGDIKIDVAKLANTIKVGVASSTAVLSLLIVALKLFGG